MHDFACIHIISHSYTYVYHVGLYMQFSKEPRMIQDPSKVHLIWPQVLQELQTLALCQEPWFSDPVLLTIWLPFANLAWFQLADFCYGCIVLGAFGTHILSHETLFLRENLDESAREVKAQPCRNQSNRQISIATGRLSCFRWKLASSSGHPGSR